MKKTINIMLIALVILTLSSCTNKNIVFELKGDQTVIYELEEDFVDPGFTAKDGETDISEFVTTTYSVNDSNDSDYIVTYTLEYNGDIEILQRNINYRMYNCISITDTDYTQCTINFDQYLHTYIRLTVTYEGDTYHLGLNEVFDNVEAIISDYHKLSDKYDNYDGVTNVKSINDSPTETHVVDERLFDMIEFTLDHQSDVNNLFNIALGPVLQVWHDYRELADPFTHTSTSIPTMEELNEKNQYTDSSKIILDDGNHTITMEDNMSIDLGGMSKGYISEVLVTYLDSLDLNSYLLNNGNSNISIGGTHPIRDHGKYILATTDPDGEKYPGYATILLGDGDQLVTSGDYQQYFIVDGTVYHHIINPLTLRPERHSRSVSIVIDGDAGLADLYSTAIFTMSIEDGIAFVDEMDGLEAIWYGMDGTIHFSENFETMYLGEIIE